MEELSLEQKVQRALDIAQVQNVMSKHAYYHGVGYHLQELRDIWVKEDGALRCNSQFRAESRLLGRHETHQAMLW
jgi:hypothetical protein